VYENYRAQKNQYRGKRGFKKNILDSLGKEKSKERALISMNRRKTYGVYKTKYIMHHGPGNIKDFPTLVRGGESHEFLNITK